MGQLRNSVHYGMPNWESADDQSERKRKGAMMSKIARNIRKQARQRTRSSSTSRGSNSILEQASKEDIIVHKNDQIHSTIPSTLHALDGKKLKKLFTKKLKTSDVGFMGRIVLPKKEAEKNLPALSNKEGIELVVKDVCTNQQWSMKYKYWCNNKSRIYVLEKTGNFVKYYQLQIDDSITLFEDELKNLYVLPTKGQTPEVADDQRLFSIIKEEEKSNDIDIPYRQEKDYDNEEETCFDKLIDEILLYQKEQESSSHKYNAVGRSSSNTEVLYSTNNASQEVSSLPNMKNR
ncbi:hypothetical protein QN277_006107 [Acacia crassicarpa]|uniref:TF-B3 domain-containing protein n=1 Tax=Acacia crassicarpa TaxID=499986 RepID=A0AAE1J134_9FABA|nr:hypothetical protein QN277_006107 [Acacia crassicarpa]